MATPLPKPVPSSNLTGVNIPRPEDGAKPQASAPIAGAEAAIAAFSQLFRVESDARRAKSVLELQLLIANETRALIRARQIFVVSRHHANSAFQVDFEPGRNI